MANRADGSLIFDTELDSTGFARGSAKLQNAVNSLMKQVDKMGVTLQNGFSNPGQINRFQTQIDSAKNSVDQLQTKLDNLGQQTISTVDYENVTKAVEKAEQALFKLYDRRDMMADMGIKDTSMQWGRLETQIRNAEEELERFERLKASMEASGQAFVSGSETDEYKNLSKAIADATEKLNAYQSTKDAAEQASAAQSGTSKVSALKSAFEGIEKATQKAVSGLKKFITHSNKSALSAKSLLKPLTSLKTMLFSRVKRMFVSYIFKDLQDALGLLQKYSESFGSAMNSLKNSSKELSANLAVTFGSLIQTIEPILTKIINAVSKVVTYFNAFFAMLSGKSTITVAKKQMKDYTKETDNAANSAKELNRQLMGFDEINKLNAPKDNSSDDTENPNDLFEEVPIDSILPASLMDYFERLKAAFKAGEWEKFGGIIAEGLNNITATVDNWINNVLAPKGVEWAGRVARILNGLIADYDWSLLGKTVADLIAAGVNTWWTFAVKFNFENLGKKIVEGINSFLATMSIPDETGLNVWQKLGQSLSKTVNGLLSTIVTVLQGVDWFKVGQAIGDFISSIDWGGVVWNFSKMAGSIIKGIGEALVGWADRSPISAALATVLATAFAGVKLGPIITAALVAKSVKNGLTGAGGAAAGGLGLESIKAMAGTATSVAAQIAKALSGIGSIISGITIAVSNFVSMLKNGFSWTKEILMVIGTGLTAVGAIILGAPALVTGVVAAVVAAVATGVVVVKEHWQDICKWFQEIPEKAKQGWDNFTNGLKTGWDAFSSGFMSDVKRVGDAIVGFFAEPIAAIGETMDPELKAAGGDIVGGIIVGIATAILNIGNWIWDNVCRPIIDAVKAGFGIHSPSTVMAEQGEYITAGLLQGITESWGAVIEFFSGAVSGIEERLSSGWAAIKQTASSAWESVKSEVTEKFTATQEKLQTGIAGISAFMTSGWANVKDSASTIWSATRDSVTSIFAAMQSRLSGSMPALTATVSGGWNSIQINAATMWSAISNTVLSKWNSLRSTMRGTDWASVGSGICSGVREGIRAGWSWLTSTVSDLAKSLLNSAKSALGIHSPSRLFRNEVGRNVGLGVAEGITDTQRDVATTVSNLAQTAVDAFGNPTLSADVASADMISGLDVVADRLSVIVGSFEAIASVLETLGGLLVPDIAVGTVIPPKVRTADAETDSGAGGTSGDEAMADRIISALIQVGEAIVKSIDDKDLSVGIGDEDIWNANNRYKNKMAMIRGSV